MKEEESAVAVEKKYDLKYDHELLPAWASTSFLSFGVNYSA